MWTARATVANTHSRAVGTPDLPFVVIPVALAAGLAAFPSIPLIAIGMWWTANTAAHNFIHRPFFPHRAANAGFSLLLTTVMGVPQDLWRQRHLSHHAARRFRLRITSQLVAEVGLLAGLWVALAALEPVAVLSLYVPGWLCGLALCAVQGHYEHSRGTTSHYGRIYNALCFNDGYHVEHHARPGLHWTQLPGRTVADARTSRWPPLLRWLEVANLNALERLVTRSRVLQRLVLHCHRRAFEALLPRLHPVRRVAIVGGALFPRTALILRDLLPAAQIVVIDSDPDHIDSARAWLGSDVEFECRRYPSPGELATAAPYDLLVIPLAFDGNRDALYAHPPATTIVHDWLWRPRDNGCVVSLALLKRLNLVRASA